MTIVNMTQHLATAEQKMDGVFDLTGSDLAALKGLLTFTALPSREEIRRRAESLAELARSAGAEAALIGGAPFLMGPLEQALRTVHIRPLYAFSVRESVETVREDGTVQKTAVFRHLGFVEA